MHLLPLALRMFVKESDADFFPIWNIVLGLNDAASARKLVRLLLADPLTPREKWEDILDSYDADSSRGLLIRYEQFLFPGIS